MLRAGGMFSFRRGGETITHSLTRWGTTLNFNRSQLAEADFQVLNGVVYADVYFVGTIEQVADEAHRRIDITKTLTPVCGGDIEVGTLVRVTLTPGNNPSAFGERAGSWHMVIDDYIPTGMRFERFGNSRGQWPDSWHPVSRQGQRVQFSAHGTLRPIIYYVRAVTPGEYVVESAFISSAYSPVWGASERSTVTIR